MITRDQQNIFDLTLQNYGSLDFVVKLSSANSLQIDEAPPIGIELTADITQGEKRIKQFVTENDTVFYNNVINESSAILANDEGDILSPKTDVIFIYQ